MWPDGFTAKWLISQITMASPSANSFGVRMVKPVTQYRQTERATKYGLLIIFLIFLTSLVALAYGVIYILLQMETFAFLAGTLLLFLILCVIMFLTRNLIMDDPKPYCPECLVWMEYAREYARAERELKIKNGSIYRTRTHDRIVLHTYELPHDLYERYSWVIRWRVARLQCLHPKEDIHPYFSYYDKRTGLSTGFDSALSKLSAAKAQITIAERKEKEYIKNQRANNLFFDEITDKLINNLFYSGKDFI